MRLQNSGKNLPWECEVARPWPRCLTLYRGLQVSIASSVIASGAKQSSFPSPRQASWIASSRSLSSGARSRDPLAPRNDGGAVRAL